MAEEVVIRDYRKEDLPAVKWLMLQYLPRFYDDIDESFSESLTEAHEKGYDPFGYFTTAKHVWIAEIEDEIVGMMSVSIKRGGSVKISPILIDEAYRGKGIGRKLIETLVQFVEKNRLRKIYCSVAIQNVGTLAFFDRLGFVREGYLEQQYRGGMTEVVYGWFPGKEIPIADDVLIREMEDKDAETIKRIALSYLPRFYSEMNEQFVSNMIEAHRRKIISYATKHKIIFVAERNGEVVGFLTSTPKRGGGVKLFPSLALSLDIEKALLAYAIQHFKKVGRRKVYGFVPSTETDRIRLYLELGFRTEEILLKPYKTGVNEVGLGKIIAEETSTQTL